MVYFDTNVFVYMAAGQDRAKRKKAAELVCAALKEGGVAISTQVLSEFTNVMLKKTTRTDAEIRRFLAQFGKLVQTDVSPSTVTRALELKAKYGIQFYEAQHLASAAKMQCSVIYTEDLNDGQVYAGVRAENPFRKMR